MKRWTIRIALALIAALGIGWFSLDEETRGLLAKFPTDRNILFWSVDQRDAAFRAMDRVPFLIRSRTIKAGGNPYPLPKGKPLAINVDAYMANQRTSALVIVHNGRIVLEKYGLGFSRRGTWTSFSVAKSVTSSLVGAAIKDGFIKSLDDKVTTYIDGLRGSAYDDVTVRQLLTMTSGIKWNEDYADPTSDVARFNEHKAQDGLDVTVSYLRTLPREAPSGTKWVYKTGETNLIGVLVSQATGKRLSDYLSQKIWQPFGMATDATWLIGSTDHEISGCCIQATTRDFARLGLFMLSSGKINGRSILPANWIEEATTKQVGIDIPGRGYGYQWWTFDDGTYSARGIFGQGIFVDPKRNLVIASNSGWPIARDLARMAQRRQFYSRVQSAVDAHDW